MDVFIIFSLLLVYLFIKIARWSKLNKKDKKDAAVDNLKKVPVACLSLMFFIVAFIVFMIGMYMKGMGFDENVILYFIASGILFVIGIIIVV